MHLAGVKEVKSVLKPNKEVQCILVLVQVKVATIVIAQYPQLSKRKWILDLKKLVLRIKGYQILLKYILKT